MKLIGFLLLFSLSVALGAEKARFDFYRLYEVKVENDLQLEVFKQISEYPDGYRFLSSPPSILNSMIQFIVPPHKFAEWGDMMNKFALHAALITNNLQDLFDKQENQNRKRKSFDWSNFQKLEEIHSWMRELAATRPNDISTFVAGISYEGREMLGLKVNIGNVAGKKSIFFEGNIHANEWIGGSTTTYIMNELLTSTDANIQDLRNKFEFWFLPVLNVDGYAYTWEVDRTWRKTRGPTKNLLCRGADPNRNWDVNWGQYGSSNNPCSNSYHGDNVFSEPETKQLAEFLETIPNFFSYISFHSYGGLMMLPYAYTRNFSVDHNLLLEIGQLAVDNLSLVRDRRYRLGTINDFFGNVAGSSVDYVQLNQQPKIVYCYELNNNHILPPEEIDPTGQELFLSVMTIFSEAVSRGLA